MSENNSGRMTRQTAAARRASAARTAAFNAGQADTPF